MFRKTTPAPTVAIMLSTECSFLPRQIVRCLANTKEPACWMSHPPFSTSRDTRSPKPCRGNRLWRVWRRGLPGQAPPTSRSSTTAWRAWDTFKSSARFLCGFSCVARCSLWSVFLDGQHNHRGTERITTEASLLLLFPEQPSDGIHHILTILPAGHLRAELVAALATELTANHSFQILHKLRVLRCALNEKRNASPFSTQPSQLRDAADASSVERRSHFVIQGILWIDSTVARESANSWHDQVD